MKPRTLRTIRQGVPDTDRNEPALVPSDLPHWATARDGSQYVAVSIHPRTLDELRKRCREYGEAAVTNLYWGCVSRWLMNSPNDMDLTNPFPVVMAAVLMVQERDCVRLGYPHHSGGEWNRPTLDFLSPDTRQEAELVAAETLSDWEKAGKPYFGEGRIKTAYQYVISCPAFSEKYVQPLDDNKEEARP